MNLLRFILIFLAFKAASQEPEFNFNDGILSVYNENYIIVNKDKFLKINHEAKIIDSLNINNEFDLDGFKLIINDSLYFINPQGGEVFSLINNSVKRIDKSFTHKNQLLSSLFLHKGTIYRFGGYGFFGARNFFTYFSEETNEWEVLKTQSEIFPGGTFDNKYFLIDDDFYLFGGFQLDENDREKNIPLKGMWKFSFEEKKWENIYKTLPFENLTYSKFDFVYNDIFYFKSGEKLISYDFKNDLFNEFNYVKSLNKGNQRYPAFAINDTIYSLGTTPNYSNNKNVVYSVSIDDLEIINKYYGERSFDFNKFLIPIGFLTLIILIIVYKKEIGLVKELKLSKNKLVYGLKKIDLDELETLFAQILLSSVEVENQKLADLISNEVDDSQKIRIKNNTIEKLNLKINMITKSKLYIQKVPSKSDKRFYSYSLKSK